MKEKRSYISVNLPQEKNPKRNQHGKRQDDSNPTIDQTKEQTPVAG